VRISGRTKITGIFGYPVEHTLSPGMHNAAFEKIGLDYCYLPFLVRPDYLEDAVKSIRALNFSGVNITIPHKEKVMVFLDEVDEEAAFIGAVNTVVNSGGILKGYNTDGRGFMRSLSENGVEVKNKDVAIIGAGGAARAIGYYLSRDAGTLSVYGRTKERAETLVRDLDKVKGNVALMRDILEVQKFHIIVNATPLGLKENDPLPFDPEVLKPGQIVCDIIYKKTGLLHEASKKGCVAIDGLGMLLWQGVLSFELWTREKPPVEVMRNALKAAIKE